MPISNSSSNIKLCVHERILISQLGYLNEGEPRFSDLLALKNGWSPIHAKRVIHEYRRFIFLAMYADHPVVPSEQVDEAWQLDIAQGLTFWGQVCEDLNTSWSAFEKSESHDFSKWDSPFQATLDAYQKHWGEPAPDDIWTEPSARQLSDFPKPLPAPQKDYFEVLKWLIFFGVGGWLLHTIFKIIKADKGFDGLFLPIFLMCVLAVIVRGFLFVSTCEKCTRHRAIKATGVEVYYPPRLEKLSYSRCKHCGNVEWSISDLRRDCSGGGGGG